MSYESPLQRVERVLRNKVLDDAVKLAQAQVTLVRRRNERPDIWSDSEPLVSVRIATYNRPQLLVERAIASVLAQTYQRFEIVVVGDHAGPETAEAIAAVDDPRVRYYNLPERPRYPEFPRFRWMTAGSAAMNEATARCRGDWIAPLDDDDAFSPDHIEVLLAAARANELEMVYGVMDSQMRDGSWVPIGSAPLAAGQITHASVLFSRRLQGIVHDPFTWILEEPGDWNLWHRMAKAGAQIGFLDRVVGRHYAEFTAVDENARARFNSPVTPEGFLEEVASTGAGYLLDWA